MCNVVPRVSRQYCSRFFVMQSCLVPLGQYCLRFGHVRCGLESIKTKLHSVFSNAMLSGDSRTTLYLDFTSVMLSQKY